MDVIHFLNSPGPATPVSGLGLTQRQRGKEMPRLGRQGKPNRHESVSYVSYVERTLRPEGVVQAQLARGEHETTRAEHRIDALPPPTLKSVPLQYMHAVHLARDLRGCEPSLGLADGVDQANRHDGLDV